MIPVYLIGGGWRAETFPQTYGRFLRAATENNKSRIAIVVAEEEGADSHAHFLRFSSAFESVGLGSADAFKTIVSAKNPLTSDRLAAIKPTGIFVCGGLTPVFYDSLCLNKTWLEYLSENRIPYCGFSAGAAIAAENAIVGGWRREIGNLTVEIADENASEDLDLLDVRQGLGLTAFAVDVHATQWGTLTRLAHAAAAGLVREGWAIDENTMLQATGETISIRGAGNAYRIRREEKIIIEILLAEN
jgi:cyanophycinase